MKHNRATLFVIAFVAFLLAASLPAAAQPVRTWDVQRDDENGALIYLFPNGSGHVEKYTPTPSPIVVAPTTGPSVTAQPTSANTNPAVATATASTTTTAPATTQPATSTPSGPAATATDTAPEVVLLNPSFDEQGAWVNYTLQTSAAGKLPQFLQASPGDGPFASLVLDGQHSMHVRGEYMCWRAGVFQRIPVPQGRWLRFGMAAFTWSNATDFFEFSTDQNTWQTWRIGIDPLGGADPRQSRIEWIEADGSDDWRRLETETISRNVYVTVFAEFNLGYKYAGECMWPVRNNWGVLDAGRLELLP